MGFNVILGDPEVEKQKVMDIRRRKEDFGEIENEPDKNKKQVADEGK